MVKDKFTINLILAGVHIVRAFLFVLAFFIVIPLLLNANSTLLVTSGVVLAIAFIIFGIIMIRDSIDTYKLIMKKD